MPHIGSERRFKVFLFIFIGVGISLLVERRNDKKALEERRIRELAQRLRAGARALPSSLITCAELQVT